MGNAIAIGSVTIASAQKIDRIETSVDYMESSARYMEPSQNIMTTPMIVELTRNYMHIFQWVSGFQGSETIRQDGKRIIIPHMSTMLKITHATILPVLIAMRKNITGTMFSIFIIPCLICTTRKKFIADYLSA